MNREEAKKLIIEIVNTQQGCKLRTLIAQLPPAVLSMGDTIISMVEELVQQQEIVEVGYTLPTYPNKTFLLPKGSQVIVRLGN